MSIFSKSMGYLTMIAASAGIAGCNSEVNAQGANMNMTANNEQPVTLPHPPLKIPMPLDKAGYKVDVTFEVSSLPSEMTYLSQLIGLRVLFTPGLDKVVDVLKEHPITVRIALFRVEDTGEIQIPLFSRVRRPAPGAAPRRGEVYELPQGEAIASLSYAEHTDAPPGTSDSSTLVLGLAGAKEAVTLGIYRFQVETLEDIPELRNVTAFFVYEEHLER